MWRCGWSPTLTDPDRLGPVTKAAVADVDNEVVVSVASVWEASIKAALGKLRAPAELWSEVERSGITLITIERDERSMLRRSRRTIATRSTE